MDVFDDLVPVPEGARCSVERLPDGARLRHFPSMEELGTFIAAVWDDKRRAVAHGHTAHEALRKAVETYNGASVVRQGH